MKRLVVGVAPVLVMEAMDIHTASLGDAGIFGAATASSC